MSSNEDQTKNNRLIFLSIVGIPVTIVLAATWLWYFVARGDIDLVTILGTSNHGTLLQPPRALDEGDLREAGGIAFAYTDLEPQWTFLIPGDEHCDVACEEVLYLTRQIHLAMGKELNRIRRFYVGTNSLANTGFDVVTLSDERPAPGDFQQYINAEQHGLKPLIVSGESFESLFAEHTRDPSTWYLVDPAGWIMMSYNSEETYKEVMADLKFLLKNSSE